MAYVNLSDVQRATGLDFNPTDQINSSEVARIITEVEARVNAILRHLGYPTVPITNVEDMLVVKRIVLKGVKVEVLEGLPGPESADTSTTRDLFEKELDRLAKGVYRLSSQNRGTKEPDETNETAMTSNVTDPKDSTLAGETNYPEPFFKAEDEI